MSGRRAGVEPRGADRIAASEFGRAGRRETMDQRWLAGKNHFRRLLHGPQYAARQRPVGAGSAVRLHGTECRLEGVSQRASRSAVRWIQADQLAFVLGIRGRKLRRKYGAPDRVGDGRSRSAVALGRIYVGRSLLRKRWPRSS